MIKLNKFVWILISICILVFIISCKNEDSAEIADVFSPFVKTSNVSSGDIDVVVDSMFEMQFVESIDPASVTNSSIYLKETNTGLQVASSISYSSTDKTVTIIPDSDLDIKTFYKIVVTKQVKDTQNNAADAKTISFDTTRPPTISAVYPTDGESDVDIGTAVRVTFSEGMNAATLNSTSIQVTNAASNQVSGTLSYSSSNHQVTFTPTQNLDPLNTHSVLVTTSATDLAGNALEGSYSSSFTTRDVYSEMLTSQGSTTGGVVYMNFTVPSYVSQLYMTVRLSGDFASSYEYATVFVNGNSIGNVSSDADSTTLVTAWSNKYINSGYWSPGTIVIVKLDATNSVNYNTGGGYYYKYEVTLSD